MKIIFTFHYDTETTEMMSAGNATLSEAAKILSTKVFDLIAEGAKRAQEEEGEETEKVVDVSEGKNK